MPGSQHGPSIKNPRVYEALRRKGMSKRRAAAISNAQRQKAVGYPDQTRFAGYTMEDWDDTRPDSFYHDTRRSKASDTAPLAIPSTGPHALFNQPGVGIRSARRRKRLKGWDAKVGQTIIGNLVRGEGGRFSGGGGNSSASRKPSARSDRAKQRQARADERRTRYAAEDDQEQTTRAEEDAYIAAGATGRERQKRRAEIAAKRRERANARRARRAEDAAMEREQRGEEDAADEQAKNEAKPKGGGGGSKKKPTEEEKRAESERKRAENRAKTAPQAGLSGAEAEFLAGAASGTLPPGSFDASKLRSFGLVVDAGDTTEATDAGRRALAAMERGDVRAALAAIQDGKAQVARDAAKRERDQQRQPAPPKKQLPPGAPGQKPGQGSPGQRVPGQRPAPRPPVSTMPITPNPKAERERNQDMARRIIRNLEERRQRSSRSRNRGIGGITNVERSNRTRRTKAKRTRTADEEKAMFASMGGGSKGGGGGGSGGGGGKLWPKGPDGKRTPQAAAAETRANGGGNGSGLTATELRQRDADIRKDRAKAEEQLETALARGNYARAEEIQKKIDQHNRDLKDLEKAGGGSPVAGQTAAQYERQQRAEYRRQADDAAKETQAAGQKLREAEAHARTLPATSVPETHIDNLRRDYEKKKQRESELRDLATEKSHTPSFTVFKDAAGHDRWASITTTAYQDKDQEWISRKAIRAVVAAGDSGAPRGPLRFWHVPGLDLGDCDYQATLGDGRMLLESGTFRSKAAARIGAEAARRGYQMSPGFVHTRSEPRGGVFDSIALFERSFVPPGRASNPYTRLLTKELRMLTEEKKKEFEALAGDTEGRALLQQLLSQAETTTKAADQAGAIYKDAPPWAQALIARLDALETTVKAPMPPEEMMEAGDTEADDGLAEMEAETMADDDLMDDEGFADMIVSKLMAAIGPLLEIEKKVGGYLSEMKGLLPQMAQQQATKDDARAKEIADLQARLKSLEGDQPRAARGASMHAQVWEAIAGAGIPVTKEQAAVLATQQANQPPAGLSGPIEIAAHKALWGDS